MGVLFDVKYKSIRSHSGWGPVSVQPSPHPEYPENQVPTLIHCRQTNFSLTSDMVYDTIFCDIVFQQYLKKGLVFI